MATQAQNIGNAFLRLVTSINTLSTRVGGLSSLTTTEKTNLVGALNEVKALIPTLSTLINDTATVTTTTWSSSKIQTQITAAVTAVLNGADSANDTLKELADRITAVAQADAGLLSFANVQTLTAPQQLQGCTNLGIGDPSTNFVTSIETQLASGL